MARAGARPVAITVEQRKATITYMHDVLDVTPARIAETLNVHPATVSRHLTKHYEHRIRKESVVLTAHFR